MDGTDPGNEDTDTESLGVSRWGGELTRGSWLREAACLVLAVAAAVGAPLVLLCGVDMLRDRVRLFGCVATFGMAKLTFLPPPMAAFSTGRNPAPTTVPTRPPVAYWPPAASPSRPSSPELGYRGRLDPCAPPLSAPTARGDMPPFRPACGKAGGTGARWKDCRSEGATGGGNWLVGARGLSLGGGGREECLGA